MKEGIPFRVSPMLARLVAKPFHKPGWVYEEKYDGFRILAYKEADRGQDRYSVERYEKPPSQYYMGLFGDGAAD